MTSVFDCPAIVDSCSLILLAKIGRLDELDALFSRVSAPSTVQAECLRSTFIEPQLLQWLNTHTVGEGSRFSRSDSGEKAVIAMALSSSTRTMVTDDGTARKLACEAGLHPVGVLGLLSESHRRRRLDARLELERLIRSGLRAEKVLIETFLASLNPDEA